MSENLDNPQDGNEEYDFDAELARLLSGDIPPSHEDEMAEFVDAHGERRLVRAEEKMTLDALDQAINRVVEALRRAHLQVEVVVRQPYDEGDIGEDAMDAVIQVRQEHPADLCHTALLVAAQEVALLLGDLVAQVSNGATSIDPNEVVQATATPLDERETAAYVIERMMRKMHGGYDEDES